MALALAVPGLLGPLLLSLFTLALAQPLGAFGRSVLPLAICLAGLAASIAAGIARAGLFVDGAPLHVLLPAAGEIVLVGLLSWQIFALHRRLRRTVALRGPG